MRVIIFIGHHKVGSSSLQRYLSENYNTFLQAGVLYPMVDFEGFSHQLSRATKKQIPPKPLPINAREAHNAFAFKMLAEHSQFHTVPNFHKNLPHTRQMSLAIDEQIKVSNPHTVVLCGEVFANFATVGTPIIERVARMFDADEFTIIATLRRPDEYLTSWQGQRLKFGHKMEPLSGVGLDHYFPTIHFNYRMMLEAWREVFPPEYANWILRDYADVLTSGGSIDDFLLQTNLPRLDDLIDVPDSNPSIPNALMDIARHGNNSLELRDAEELRHYLLHASERIELISKSEIEVFGEENRAKLLDNFAPINQWLEGFTDQAPFFKEHEDMNRIRPISEREVSREMLKLLLDDAPIHLNSHNALAFLKDMTA